MRFERFSCFFTVSFISAAICGICWKKVHAHSVSMADQHLIIEVLIVKSKNSLHTVVIFGSVKAYSTSPWLPTFTHIGHSRANASEKSGLDLKSPFILPNRPFGFERFSCFSFIPFIIYAIRGMCRKKVYAYSISVADWQFIFSGGRCWMSQDAFALEWPCIWMEVFRGQCNATLQIQKLQLCEMSYHLNHNEEYNQQFFEVATNYKKIL